MFEEKSLYNIRPYCNHYRHILSFIVSKIIVFIFFKLIVRFSCIYALYFMKTVRMSKYKNKSLQNILGYFDASVSNEIFQLITFLLFIFFTRLVRSKVIKPEIIVFKFISNSSFQWRKMYGESVLLIISLAVFVDPMKQLTLTKTITSVLAC